MHPHQKIGGAPLGFKTMNHLLMVTHVIAQKPIYNLNLSYDNICLRHQLNFAVVTSIWN